MAHTLVLVSPSGAQVGLGGARALELERSPEETQVGGSADCGLECAPPQGGRLESAPGGAQVGGGGSLRAQAVVGDLRRYGGGGGRSSVLKGVMMEDVQQGNLRIRIIISLSPIGIVLLQAGRRTRRYRRTCDSLAPFPPSPRTFCASPSVKRSSAPSSTCCGYGHGATLASKVALGSEIMFKIIFGARVSDRARLGIIEELVVRTRTRSYSQAPNSRHLAGLAVLPLPLPRSEPLEIGPPAEGSL